MKKIFLSLVILTAGSISAHCNTCPENRGCAAATNNECRPFGCPEDEWRTQCGARANHHARFANQNTKAKAQ